MKSDTFERHYQKCQEPAFLHSQNIGNEIPFYIIPYEPKEERSVSTQIDLLVKRIGETNIRVLKLDLFTLCIDLRKEEGLLEDLFLLEKEEEPAYFLDAFDSALNDSVVTQSIQKRIRKADPDVVFIEGIGKIYPFKKIHPLINSMHAKTESKSIVFFYPGIYDGHAFRLFGLTDGNGGELFKSNYYRAYNLE
jgi:hypothetical protein